MPEKGMKFLPKNELLTYEEMTRLVSLLAEMGISKIRITGGEPMVRSNLLQFLSMIKKINGIEEIHITTNGILIGKYVEDLKDLGISSVNLSLDTLNKERFFQLTRRNEFDKVMSTFKKLIDFKIRTKINAVVIDHKNTEDLIPLAELARTYPVNVRFIEEMPFNGSGSHYNKLVWNHQKIYAILKDQFPGITRMKNLPTATAVNYQIPGFIGNVGIIAAYSRTFCGSCNRIRINSQGILQTCLYDGGVLNLKDLLRSSATDVAIQQKLRLAINRRAKDGFEAEQNRQGGELKESMSTIGG